MKTPVDDRQQQRCRGRGPGSYWIANPDRVFAELAPAEGSVFLDLGCGPGDYSIHAARLVGPRGAVFAVDRSPGMVAELAGKARKKGLANIKTLTRDISAPLPLDQGSVDTCFLCTVLHIMRPVEMKIQILAEAHRVLAPTGVLAVLEIKKEPMPFGPPLEQRIAEQEMLDLARQCGFKPSGFLDLECFYLTVFQKA